MRFDTSGRLTTIVDAAGARTKLTYNASGLVTRVDDPFGRNAQFTCDGNRNLVALTDMGGYTSKLTYDADVYVTSMSTAHGSWKFYIEASDAGPTDYLLYSVPGGKMWQNYRITIADPNGAKEEHYYSEYEGYAWYVSPNNYVDYSVALNNASASVPKTVYRYQKFSDGKARISRTERPDGSWTEESYDPLTRMLATRRDGHGTSTADVQEYSYTWNAKGRLLQSTDPRGNTVSYTYAPNGLDVTQVQTALGSILLGYDAQRRPSSYQYFGRAAEQTIYDTLGRKVSWTASNGEARTYFYWVRLHRSLQ